MCQLCKLKKGILDWEWLVKSTYHSTIQIDSLKDLEKKKIDDCNCLSQKKKFVLFESVV